MSERTEMKRKWMCILCALGMMLPTFGCDEDDAPEQPAPKPPIEPEQPEQPEQPEAGTYIVVAPATLITSESGTTLRGSLALDKAPESPVVVTLVSSDMTEGTVEPQTLTFDGQNYATPQYFSITGQPDGIIDGDITYTVTATATTDDTSFSSGTVFSWTIINRDIDGANPIPSPSKARIFGLWPPISHPMPKATIPMQGAISSKRSSPISP